MADGARTIEIMELAYCAADTADAQAALAELEARYGPGTSVDDADVVIALGGDGYLLHTLHDRVAHRRVPIYGMNRGTVGFLMNRWASEGLHERLDKASAVDLVPLRATITRADGTETELLAINEVALFRATGQAAHLRISVNGAERIGDLVGDGALVATPAGSTAYNLSCRGPILPLTANLLAVTPISPFRPRRWPGALIPDTCTVTLDVIDADRRPVSVTADHIEVRDPVSVTVTSAPDATFCVLFDHDAHLDDRIVAEQFAT